MRSHSAESSYDLKRNVDLLPWPRQLDPVMEGLIRETIARNRKHLGRSDEGKTSRNSSGGAGSGDSVPLVNE